MRNKVAAGTLDSAMVLRNANYWVVTSALGILALGGILLFIPVSEIGPNARITGWLLLGAGLLEVAGALTRRRPAVRRIELALGFVTLGAALLILLRPQAYPLLFVAIVCLLVRGTGALVAAFLSSGETRLWVVGRGLIDLALGGILLAGAPLAAIVSIISGNRWPDRSGAVLTNFVAASMIVTAISLLGLALRAHVLDRREEE
jgi:uncharacterized membrane protein HdeD (DUF308 family)